VTPSEAVRGHGSTATPRFAPGSTSASPCRAHDCLPALAAPAGWLLPLLRAITTSPRARGNSPRSTGPRRVRANHAARCATPCAPARIQRPGRKRRGRSSMAHRAIASRHATPRRPHDRVRRFAQPGSLTALRHSSSCPVTHAARVVRSGLAGSGTPLVRQALLGPSRPWGRLRLASLQLQVCASAY